MAISAYVAAGIAKAPMGKTGWTAFFLGIASFLIPFAFVYSPRLLLIGPLEEVALATVTALIGIYSLAVGVEGYWLTPINVVQRVIAIAAAIVLVIPGWKTDLIGIALLAILVPWQILQRKRRDRTVVPA